MTQAECNNFYMECFLQGNSDSFSMGRWHAKCGTAFGTMLQVLAKLYPETDRQAAADGYRYQQSIQKEAARIAAERR